jgi:DNA polymerase-1
MLTDAIREIISKNGQDQLCYEIEMPLIEVLADMEYRGFKVNVDALMQFSSRLDDRIASAEDDI